MLELKIQSVLIERILSPLGVRAERLPEKTRDKLFIAAGTVIFLFHFFNNAVSGAGIMELRYIYTFVVDCLMLGVMAFVSLCKEFHPVKFDKVLLILGGIIGLFALITAVTQDTKRLSAAILCLTIYPFLFLIWNNNDISTIFKRLICICRNSFFAFLLISFLFYPVKRRKYDSFFYNTNGLAFYLTLVVCCLAVELFQEKKDKKLWLDVCLFGLAATLLIYSNSRTGQLAVLTSLDLSLVLWLLKEKGAAAKLFLKRFPVLLLSVVVFLFSTVYIFRIPYNVAVYMYKEKTAEQIPLPIKPSDNNSLHTMEPAEEMTALQDILSTERVKVEDTRGGDARISIWSAWLRHLSFWGHSLTDIFEWTYNGEIERGGTAHNTFIQAAWNYGIPAGVAYLLFCLWSGIKSVIFGMKSKDPYALLPFVISVAFGITAMLASIGSFGYMICLYYFLVQTPLMRKESTAHA